MLRKLLKYEFIFLIKDFSRIYIIYGIEVLILTLLLLPFYLSVFDANDAVCTACYALIMSDNNNSFVVLFVHLVQERDNFLACFLVEVARWFVAQHYLRVVGKSSCYRTSLLLTARKL